MDLREALEALEAALAEPYPGEFLNVDALKTVVSYVRETAPADALRELATDIERDALDQDPETPVEQGLVEGLGRAAGRAKARAEELDGD